MPDYIELLKDPRWQKRRLEIFQRDEFQCQGCADKTKTLHIHHRYYKGGKKPWEYDDDALVTLCEECHAAITKTKKLLDAALLQLPFFYDQIVLGFTEALVAASTIGDDEGRISIPDYSHGAGVHAVVLMFSNDASTAGFRLAEVAQKSGGMIDVKKLIRQALEAKESADTKKSGG